MVFRSILGCLLSCCLRHLRHCLPADRIECLRLRQPTHVSNLKEHRSLYLSTCLSLCLTSLKYMSLLLFFPGTVVSSDVEH